MDDEGHLALQVGGSELRLRTPLVFQEVAGARHEIPARYALAADGTVRFEVGDYDQSEPLVIDPVLEYSTYLGGSGHDDTLFDIAVDAEGHAYVVGSTTSLDFPVVGGVQDGLSGSSDAFVAKLGPSGSSLAYATTRSWRCGTSSVRGRGYNAPVCGA